MESREGAEEMSFIKRNCPKNKNKK